MRRRFAAALALTVLAPAAGCGGLPPNVPAASSLEASRLEGGWHVLASNFPMWLDGKKTDPIFIYHVQPDAGPPAVLDDSVAYNESGRRESILGTDTQDAAMPSHFTWRGKGLLAAFASDWVIAAAAPDFSWIVLYFTKTLATPEGVDVISRTPSAPPDVRAAISSTLSQDPFLAAKSQGLVWLGGSGAD